MKRKCRRVFVLVSSLCLLSLACKSRTETVKSVPPDFTGFWKWSCSDAFGVQIKQQTAELFSVSFCGPGGCFEPGSWMPNTPIVGDPQYHSISPTTLAIRHGDGWQTLTKCTSDTNPVPGYARMPTESSTPGRVASSPGSDSKAGIEQSGNPEKDPHRPPCTSAQCRKVRSFLKAHYCGESPFGNGPDEGCDTRQPTKLSAGIKAAADFNCKWDESSGKAKCEQRGEPSQDEQRVLLREMRRLGLPQQAEAELHFVVWEASSEGWTLAVADYEHVTGSDLTVCELIVVFEQNGRVQILRKLPFQKTDADVPLITSWSAIDIADVDGDGRMEVVLQGDAYEDHWYEVVGIRDGSFKTIFSGLGYYL